VDLVELADTRPTREVAARLRAHGVKPGTVVEVGGPAQLLTTVGCPCATPLSSRSPTNRRTPAGAGVVLVRPAIAISDQQAAP